MTAAIWPEDLDAARALVEEWRTARLHPEKRPGAEGFLVGLVAAALADARPAGEWVAGRWWRVLDPAGAVWCETSDEQEARERLRPGDRLQRSWERREAQWRDVDGFTCPRCRRTSHHPEDLRQGYCGACHAFTGEPRP